MRRVFSSASLWEAREIVTLLEQNRVPAILANEHTAATPGVLPFNPGMTVDAEVWVLDDELAPRAARLIGEFQQAGAAQPQGRWRCACGEESPASFEVCWACGRPGPGPLGAAP